MPSRKSANRFQDILDSIDDIETFTTGMSRKQFVEDRKTRFAVERALAILSEAAVKLGDDAPALVPDIPWADIRGIGNHIRHGYDAVNADTLWEIITGDLASLRAACVHALDQLSP